jgi:peptidyl-prolyl cis-trans isomerase A (cyclophilin A)
MIQKFFSAVKSRVLAALVLVVLAARCPAQYAGTNGIFAEFNTRMGSYTCVVLHASAPKAAASFIGLATGRKAWLDPRSGLVRTNPFYNGLTFHRVASGFVIQAGSPIGDGSDGPGYTFTDETTNGLQFNKFGVLAMANTGPDSNGSQFFVLATDSYPSLNGGYTIFGQLYGGSNVVAAINRVATDANEKPLTNVFINSIRIVTNGAAASAFFTNLNGQGLAMVTNLNLRLAKSGTNVSLIFSNRLYADNRLYASTNLIAWNGTQLGIETTLPSSNATNLQPMTGAAQFFRAAQVLYPTNTFAPKNLFGKTLTLFYTNGTVGTNIHVFDSAGTGTFNFIGVATGAVTSYSWLQSPFNGRLPLIFYSTSIVPCELRLNWRSTTNGNFTGTAYPYYPFPIFTVGLSGTFTNSP